MSDNKKCKTELESDTEDNSLNSLVFAQILSHIESFQGGSDRADIVALKLSEMTTLYDNRL